MTAVLVDTNVLTQLHPSRVTTRAQAVALDRIGHRTVAISVQSAAELWRWSEHRSWGTKRQLDLENFLYEGQRFTIIPIDGAIARTWGVLMVHARRAGRRLETADAWIAATASTLQLPLLTFDADFLGLSFDRLVVEHLIFPS